MYGQYGYAQNMPKFNAQGTFMGRQEVIRVNGENGARAYNLPPESSVLLLDNNAPVIYLKITDGAGYPSITAYEISPLMSKEEKNNTKLDEIDKRLSKIEEELKNGKSNVINAERKQSARLGTADTPIQKYAEYDEER